MPIHWEIGSWLAAHNNVRATLDYLVKSHPRKKAGKRPSRRERERGLSINRVRIRASTTAPRPQRRIRPLPRRQGPFSSFGYEKSIIE